MPQKFIIRSISSSSNYIRFDLNINIAFNNSTTSQVYRVNRFPFDRYRVGDEIEIDIDALKNKSSYEYLNNASLVKKIPYGRKSLYSWYNESYCLVWCWKKESKKYIGIVNCY